jgi:DNA-directed RNA polymerase specialized sigma subunit
MASEYLNNKKLEKIIILFQKIKKYKNMYKYLVDNINEQTLNTPVEKQPESWSYVKQEYVKNLNDYDVTQKDLAAAFYTLSENIVRYAKFNLIDPDDSVQEGVLICFEKLDRFDPKFGKAFNYMTTCILNHFKQLYRSARNYTELKKKYQDHISRELQSEINYSRIPKSKE